MAVDFEADANNLVRVPQRSFDTLRNIAVRGAVLLMNEMGPEDRRYRYAAGYVARALDYIDAVEDAEDLRFALGERARTTMTLWEPLGHTSAVTRATNGSVEVATSGNESLDFDPVAAYWSDRGINAGARAIEAGALQLVG
ncbi:MAG TPA: hypothetical protein VLH84_00940 [Patescibacteria group bacterium]|nr:hypothetical protein [Patescibacteria group bacterium]